MKYIDDYISELYDCVLYGWGCGCLQLTNDILDVNSVHSYYPHNLPTFSMWFPTTGLIFFNGWLNQLTLYYKNEICIQGSFWRCNLMINTLLNRTMFYFYIIMVTLNSIYFNQNHGFLIYFKFHYLKFHYLN